MNMKYFNHFMQRMGAVSRLKEVLGIEQEKIYRHGEDFPLEKWLEEIKNNMDKKEDW